MSGPSRMKARVAAERGSRRAGDVVEKHMSTSRALEALRRSM
ncbi:hypothetical protein [Pseudenhygromyxa sp. WMMC2535]|nr:hypothetical protein [Pseudenhygromyxa sp. WMMC2535]